MARENLPFLQFYVGDWFKDPGIQMLDATERGIWLHMIFLMWEGKDKGRLTLNSKPYPIEGIAAQLRISSNVVISTIGKIIDYGIGDIDANGVLSNRRMLRDYALREQARINGMKGGNPHLKKKEASLPLTRDEMSRPDKPKKTKEIAIAIPKYQQPDRSGNPRRRLNGFKHIHISDPELERLKAEFARLNLTKEQKKLAVEKVDVWLDENPKKLAASSEHVTRILDWGIKAALEMQTTESKAKRAKKVEEAPMATERKEFLTAAEKRKRAHEELQERMRGAVYTGIGGFKSKDDAGTDDAITATKPCALLD